MYILIGIILIIISAIFTQKYIKGNPIASSMTPDEVDEFVPGTGVVPKWVSLINILGWIILVVGVISFFV